jgi:hypothetical protein
MVVGVYVVLHPMMVVDILNSKAVQGMMVVAEAVEGHI